MIKKRDKAPNNAKAKATHSYLTLITKELIIPIWQSRVAITLNIPEH